MNVDEIRNKILIAREKRALMRKQCSRSIRNSLSLSLNIPGYPKSMPLISAFFDDVLSECIGFLQAHGIAIDRAHEIKHVDEAGNFYLAPLPNGLRLADIKALAEAFEGSHPFGRIIDIDLADPQCQPLSSGKLKRCLLCEQPAIVCMREATHSYEELRDSLVRGIRGYLAEKAKRQTCKHLAALALKAILYEISVSPKPGLVGRFETGSHCDMNYFTFLSSTSVLAGYFEELALAGYAYPRDDLREALPLVRTVGLKMEASMFSATNGVNTQKGLIFLIGLALFSSGFVIARDRRFDGARCREVIAAVCANLVQNELATATGDGQTHGQTCFQRYGLEGAGIRREAETGMQSVFEHGLPELKSALTNGAESSTAQINKGLIRTLLRLMTVANDTNILYRKDIETLKTVQRMAQCVLDARDGKDEAERYARLRTYCRQEYISPGGSADLLAVTLFIYFVERAFSSPSEPVQTD